MIGSFNIGDFDLKFSITEIKLRQIKALYNVICSSVVLVRLIILVLVVVLVFSSKIL